MMIAAWSLGLCFCTLIQQSAAWSASYPGRPILRALTHRQAFNPENSDAQYLTEKAEKLRKDIMELEESKLRVEQERQRRENEERQRQHDLRTRYSALLPILKPDGTVAEERIQFPPYYDDESSFITTCQATLPLGLVLGESESFAGAVVVDQVAEESSAARAGVQVGDLVRAFTACKMQMEQPAWQLIAGGIGRPKMFRYIHPVGVDRRVSFDMHLEALRSNRFDPEGRPAILVLERKE